MTLFDVILCLYTQDLKLGKDEVFLDIIYNIKRKKDKVYR